MAFPEPWDTRISTLIMRQFPQGLRHVVMLPDSATPGDGHPDPWFRARDLTLAIDVLDERPHRNREAYKGIMHTLLRFEEHQLWWLIDNHPDIAQEIYDELVRQTELGNLYAVTGSGRGPIDDLDDPNEDRILAWLRENPESSFNKLVDGVKIRRDTLREVVDRLVVSGHLIETSGSRNSKLYSVDLGGASQS